jgi:hypothetical protein
MNNTTITMPIKEYEALKHNVVHLKQIIDNRTILVVNDFGTEKMRYVSVEGNKLFSELQTRVKYLEQREKNWGEMAMEWNDKRSEYERMVDGYHRLSRMRENVEANYRALNGRYCLLQRELSDLKEGRSSIARRLFGRFWRK